MKKFPFTVLVWLSVYLLACTKETHLVDTGKPEGVERDAALRQTAPSLVQWQACLGTTGDDFGTAIAPAAGGGYFVAGTTGGRAKGYVMKLAADGHQSWQQPALIDGNGNDEIFGLAATPDGGCLAAGLTSSSTLSGFSGSTDVLLAKVSAGGEVEWTMAIGTPGAERANAITATPDGGYALTGYSNDDLLIVKLNSAGNGIVWQKQYQLPGYKGSTGYAIAHQGDALITGGRTLTLENASARPLFATVALSDGSARVLKAIDHLAGALAFSLAADAAANHVVLAGRSGCDALVFSVDANGNTGWVKTYGGSGCGDIFKGIELTESGYAVVGETNSKNGDIPGSKGGVDLWLMQLNADGSKKSSYIFGGKGNDNGEALLAIAPNNYVLVGSTTSTSGDVKGNQGGSDIWTVAVKLP